MEGGRLPLFRVFYLPLSLLCGFRLNTLTVNEEPPRQFRGGNSSCSTSVLLSSVLFSIYPSIGVPRLMNIINVNLQIGYRA